MTQETKTLKRKLEKFKDEKGVILTYGFVLKKAMKTPYSNNRLVNVYEFNTLTEAKQWFKNNEDLVL